MDRRMHGGQRGAAHARRRQCVQVDRHVLHQGAPPPCHHATAMPPCHHRHATVPPSHARSLAWQYMGKDSVNISAAATVLHEADKKVREHPSSADDKLTAERTSKHFCQHIINHR